MTVTKYRYTSHTEPCQPPTPCTPIHIRLLAMGLGGSTDGKSVASRPFINAINNMIDVRADTAKAKQHARDKATAAADATNKGPEPPTKYRMVESASLAALNKISGRSDTQVTQTTLNSTLRRHFPYFVQSSDRHKPFQHQHTADHRHCHRRGQQAHA